MKHFELLLDLQRRQALYDGWFDECDPTYSYEAIRSELEEVKNEMGQGNSEKLEDELGDVLWAYLTLVSKFHSQGVINMDSICDKTYQKFSERMPHLLEGRRETNSQIRNQVWEATKARQKARKTST